MMDRDEVFLGHLRTHPHSEILGIAKVPTKWN